MTLSQDARKATGLSRDALDRRIRFLEDRAILEIDLSGLRLTTTEEVNLLYDRLEERIEATGEDSWFFLINYSQSHIDPAAWFAFSRRGKTLNHAHSMGSVRFDASDETRAQIERDAGTEAFDANLFADRASALERIAAMPSARRQKIAHVPTHTPEEIAARVRIDPAAEILEIDLSRFVLEHSLDVTMLYDHLEARIEESGRRWYFLINYNDTRIMPAAWVEFAKRGKRLNLGGSLGTVRYEAGTETEADIRLRAESQGFQPNIRATRDAALERIAEMKAESAGS